MSVRAVVLGLCLAQLSGCLVVPKYDEQMACNLSRAMIPEVQRGQLGARDLAEAVAPDPHAFAEAIDGYRQALAGATLSGIGAGGLVAGFIMGFATDPSQEGTRIAGYSIVGGAIGLFGTSLILAFTGKKARERAVRHFLMYANSCGLTQ